LRSPMELFSETKGIDMTTAVRRIPAVFVFALAALASDARPANQERAPATTVRTSAPDLSPAPLGLKIILLPPTIRFEDVRGYTPAIGADLDYEQLLIDTARRAVGSRATLLDMNKLQPPIEEACRKLAPLASRLARGDVNDEAADDLARLAAFDECYVVLVQFFRLRTGPGRSWNSATGAITSSTASTLIQAALVSGKTGKVIWKGERLVRNKALKPTDGDFRKALTLLYQDFDIKGIER
jgi:hypothetical protein